MSRRPCFCILFAALALAGCERGGSSVVSPPDLPWTAAAVAHGGVGSPPSRTDGCRAAVDAALKVLEEGGDVMDAAVAGAIVLEDDERFNAGIGSRVRIDGETVQMDAGVMHSDGSFGSVAVIEHVQNPIKVARAVMDTPHLMIAGDGATRFARTLGLPEYDPATPARKEATRKIQERLQSVDPNLPKDWKNFDWKKHWNFEKTLRQAGIAESELGHDTIGVVVRDAEGNFAVSLSTGGTAITLRGRIGDTPILGAGLYAGPFGAVAATGKGERIIENNVGRAVHDWMSRGMTAQAAADKIVAQVRNQGSIGLVVIGGKEIASSADRDMAWAGRELGSETWLGPDVTP